MMLFCASFVAVAQWKSSAVAINLIVSRFHEEAGGSPAASHFLLLRQKKVTQEKVTLVPASLR